MGFRENLKDELNYQDMKVKELADKSGVPKRTIDHYLTENSYMPNAENAVKIARALNVSVEYLVTGRNGFPSPVVKDSVARMAKKLDRLSESDLHFFSEILDRLAL